MWNITLERFITKHRSILDNAFSIHKPGTNVYRRDLTIRRDTLTAKTNQLIRKFIYSELKVIYGDRKGCAV